MHSPIKVSKRTVRRFLLAMQGLLADQSHTHFTQENPNGTQSNETLLRLIKQLECVQIDPVSAVRPNQHLVLKTRLREFQPEMLNDLLAEKKTFEYMANAACVLPIEDYPLFEPRRRRYREQLQQELDKIQPVVQQVLHRLECEGPLPARVFKAKDRVHGYWDHQAPKTKVTTHALNLLLDTGMIMVVRREGTERFYDLAEKHVPSEIMDQAQNIDHQEALSALLLKYMRAYRVFEPTDPRFGWQKLRAKERRNTLEQLAVDGLVVPLEIEGVKRSYYILSSDITHLEKLKQLECEASADQYENHAGLNGFTEEGIHFLPPLDNLLWRRERLADFFNFYYKWEIYTPAAKRQYGYYAMPILYGDQLIGRIDPRLDREKKHMTIQLLHFEPEVEVDARLKKQLSDALETFCHAHDAESYSMNKVVPTHVK